MRLFYFLIALLALLAGNSSSTGLRRDSDRDQKSESEDLFGARDWFTLRRCWPEKVPDVKAYLQAMDLARHFSLAKTSPAGFNTPWRAEGPDNIGGRINAIAVDPSDSSVIYAGNAAGGVFKTVDGGTSWKPVFDDLAYLAIGSITIDPQDHNTIYVGTGDPQNTIASYLGNGIYRSRDAGKTWTHLGLDKENIVAKIAVHPDSSNIIYAACTGTPFIRDNNRGLYKTTDGGKTWQNVLFLNQDAGIIDVILDPSNPSTIYATGWKTTYVDVNAFSSPVNQIYKSTDAGKTWKIMGNGLPLFNMGRIGLVISKKNSNKLYAFVCDSSHYTELMGVYKTTDGGDHWTILPTTGLDTPVLGHFGWYFGKLGIDPVNDDNIYLCSVDLWKFNGSTSTWSMAAPAWFTYEVHADKHDLQWVDDDHFIIATDGGAYKYERSTDHWRFLSGIPNTQFYHVAVNPFDSINYYGGAQDNGTSSGNAKNRENWQRISGGDGFQPLFSRTDPDLSFSEYQNGEIQNMLEFSIFFNPQSYNDRVGWDMPYISSTHTDNTYYAGTYRVFKNTGTNASQWQPISQDLSTGKPATYPQNRNIITTLSESPLSASCIYAGTSDGNVWKTENGGTNWTQINGNLPVRYVTSVKASPNNAKTVFVAHSGYKYNEYIPHLHKSTDLGGSWTDISGDMPPVGINDILVMPYANDSLIFLATDAGVYGTLNGGQNWYRLGSGMPVLPVNDIEYNPANRRLIAGTFSRSLLTYPMDSIVSRFTSGIDYKNQQSIGLSIFPNPVGSQLNISIADQSATKANYSLSIINLSGKCVYNATVKEGSSTLQLPENMAQGAYILQVSSEKGTLASRKFLKIKE